MTIPVIFRKSGKHSHSLCIAIFPSIPGNSNGDDCLTYIGENVNRYEISTYNLIIKTTTPVTPKEYKELYDKLTKEMYYNLRVISRASPQIHHMRRYMADMGKQFFVDYKTEQKQIDNLGMLSSLIKMDFPS